MPAYKSLIDAWREQAVSRFAKALVAEMEAHGGPDAYCARVGVKKPTMGTWVRNTSKPGPVAAQRMAEVSPSLIPHLQERGCLDAVSPLENARPRLPSKNQHYQRRQAPVPLQASAQTTETAQRQHVKALTEAEQRAFRLARLDKIRARVRTRKHTQRSQERADRKLAWFHRNPCMHGGAFAVVEGIGSGAADVGVPESFNTED